MRSYGSPTNTYVKSAYAKDGRWARFPKTRALCVCGAEPEAAMRLLKRMRSSGVSPDTVTYNSIIDAYARAGDLYQA